jgi:hypothetical protein
VAPVEEDRGVAGWHLVRQANRAAIHELQGKRWEPVALLEFFSHLCPPHVWMQSRVYTCLLSNLPLVGRPAAYASSDKVSTQWRKAGTRALWIPLHDEDKGRVASRRRAKGEKVSEEIQHDIC